MIQPRQSGRHRSPSPWHNIQHPAIVFQYPRFLTAHPANRYLQTFDPRMPHGDPRVLRHFLHSGMAPLDGAAETKAPSTKQKQPCWDEKTKCYDNASEN